MNHLVLVSGTRTGLSKAEKALIELALSDCLRGAETLHVMHGDCQTGVDAYVAKSGKPFSVLPVPAQWETLGGSAGPSRNEAMVSIASILRQHGWRISVLAFPRGRSIGTRGLIRAAKLSGLDVKVTELEEH